MLEKIKSLFEKRVIKTEEQRLKEAKEAQESALSKIKPDQKLMNEVRMEFIEKVKGLQEYDKRLFGKEWLKGKKEEKLLKQIFDPVSVLKEIPSFESEGLRIKTIPKTFLFEGEMIGLHVCLPENEEKSIEIVLAFEKENIDQGIQSTLGWIVYLEKELYKNSNDNDTTVFVKTKVGRFFPLCDLKKAFKHARETLSMKTGGI